PLVQPGAAEARQHRPVPGLVHFSLYSIFFFHSTFRLDFTVQTHRKFAMLPLRRHDLKSLGVVYPIIENFATEKAAPLWGRSRLSKKADAFSAKGVSLRSAPRSSACGGRFDARSAQSVFPTP